MECLDNKLKEQRIKAYEAIQKLANQAKLFSNNTYLIEDGYQEIYLNREWASLTDTDGLIHKYVKMPDNTSFDCNYHMVILKEGTEYRDRKQPLPVKVIILEGDITLNGIRIKAGESYFLDENSEVEIIARKDTLMLSQLGIGVKK